MLQPGQAEASWCQRSGRWQAARPLQRLNAQADVQVYGAGVWASLALMCASAVCGSITDLAFDMEGYLWQLVRSCLQPSLHLPACCAARRNFHNNTHKKGGEK